MSRRGTAEPPPREREGTRRVRREPISQVMQLVIANFTTRNRRGKRPRGRRPDPDRARGRPEGGIAHNSDSGETALWLESGLVLVTANSRASSSPDLHPS